MSDNSLKISFDYKKPDEAVLIIYKVFGGGYFGGETGITVVRTIVGKKAVAMYSELSGKTIEQIEKEAECNNG